MKRLFALAVFSVLCNSAFALKSDKDQSMYVDSDRSKLVQNTDPEVTDLDGHVKITQGSMESHGDHAKIYKNPSGVADESGNIGGIKRIVLTGKPAHLQQVQDGDCSLMTADAMTIDYNNVSGVAVLTGSVIAKQVGKNEIRGEHVIYNTVTGEMEGGDSSPNSRVRTVFEPASKTPPPPNTNNCGFPGTPKAASDKPAKTPKAAKKP